MPLTTRAFLTHLPPSLALIIGTLELLPFGILGIYQPASFAAGYGLPIDDTSPSHKTPTSADQKPNTNHTNTKQTPIQSQSEEDQQTKKALITAIAARNIQNGVLLLTFGLILRDRKSLGVAVLAGLVTTVADTVIVRAYGVRESIGGHYVGIVNSLLIGGSLLYWRSGDRLW